MTKGKLQKNSEAFETCFNNIFKGYFGRKRKEKKKKFNLEEKRREVR